MKHLSILNIYKAIKELFSDDLIDYEQIYFPDSKSVEIYCFDGKKYKLTLEEIE